jgi:hypothetical protein
MRDLTRKFNILVALLAIAMFASVSQARYISGSAHDFGTAGWSGGQTCGPCHTPHNGDVSVTEAPLWAHTLTDANYKTHVSDSASAATEVDETSRLCLSCHDGTVAMDSFMGNSAASTDTHMTGSTLLGTDLTNDHPIGAAALWSETYSVDGTTGALTWNGDQPSSFVSQGASFAYDDAGTPKTATVRAKVKAMPAGGAYENQFAISCATCHRAHTGSLTASVTTGGVTPDGATVNGSYLCLSCHAK